MVFVRGKWEKVNMNVLSQESLNSPFAPFVHKWFILKLFIHVILELTHTEEKRKFSSVFVCVSFWFNAGMKYVQSSQNSKEACLSSVFGVPLRQSFVSLCDSPTKKKKKSLDVWYLLHAEKHVVQFILK